MKVPNVGPAQVLLCKAGWHRRNKRSRHRIGHEVTATCRGCGAAMVHDRGGWRIDTLVPPPTGTPTDGAGRHT